MKIDFYAGSWAHYTNHLYPLWVGLPEDLRGQFSVIASSGAERRAHELGIPTVRFRQYRKDVLVCVASFEDYRATKPASVIFVNHGVGQTYKGDPKFARMGSYSGGPGRERTVLFLCTGERDAALNRESYPDIPCIPVGVPYLDKYLMQISLNKIFRPTVTFSFHANIQAIPETRWAVDWAKGAIRELVANKENIYSHTFLGHSHPRSIDQMVLFWRKMGVPFEPDWFKVLEQTDVYVIDNSSTGYEAAALGIPTVWWNPPFYRRDVHHGLRFWDAIPGVEVENPEEIGSAIKIALFDPPEIQEKRARAVSMAYGDADGNSLVDGHATERAVDAIWRLTQGSLTSPTPSSSRSPSA